MSEQVVEKDLLLQLQAFWNKNSKTLLIGVSVIVIAVAGFWGYNNFIAGPKNEKAADLMVIPQKYFGIDSFNLALNGDGQSKGFMQVIKNYGSTPSGNLAKYYAGVCYLHLGDFANAVKYLKDFDANGAQQIQLMAYGALGDAYSEQKKNSEAVESYKKAAHAFEKDEANSAEYLFRAALLLETEGKTKEALELYKELKEKFPKTDKGFQVDKYIYRLSVEPNNFSVK